MKPYIAGENLLPALAYGDACGLPFEAQIAQQAGVITELPSITYNEYLAIPDDLKGSKGLWSDDTHLSLASMVSAIRSKAFIMYDQAKVHVEAYDHVAGSTDNPDLIPPIVTEQGKNGFGPSTIQSIGRLAAGIDFSESGSPTGKGNGVLMKMAPMVYWQYANGMRGSEGIDQTIAFTKMTHATPEAVITSLVHRYVLMNLLDVRQPVANDQEISTLYSKAVSMANYWEQKLGIDNTTSGVMARVGQLDFENRDALLAKIEGKNGGGFYAPETLMMAYGSFTIESTFPDCVYRAVELGGDSDSIGSIVGGMAACYWGELDFPADTKQLYAIDRLRRVSKEFTTLALKGGV